ncbi:MAG: peptidylprolyl isomerase [Rubrimonas sp.]
MNLRSLSAAVLCAMCATSAVAQDADTVVATVNGQPITLADVIAVRGDLPAQYQSLPDEALYDGIREQLIAQRVLSDAADAEGLADDPEVARALSIQRQGILAEFFMRRAMAERLTDDAVQAMYDERIASAQPVQEVRASHILVATEEEARGLKSQLDEGADFADLAVEHGTDGTRFQGGDLGYFTRDTMVEPFAEAAFAMDVGEVSEPVQTQFGWHLIKLVDKRERPNPTLDEVRGEIEQELGGRIARELLSELRDAASVEAPEDRPGVEQLRNDALIAR